MPPKPKVASSPEQTSPVTSPNPAIQHVELNVADIILSEKNPRQINEAEFKKLCESIKNDPAFLYQRPPLINEVAGKFYCYAGHMRVRAAKANGSVTVPCFVEKDVPVALQDERMIRDNTHAGVWDVDILTSHFDTNNLKDWGVKDFNFNVTVDLLPGAKITKDDGNAETGGVRITDDDKAQFNLVMDIENKKKFVALLNKIKEEKGFTELELALMELVNSYPNV